LHQQEEDVMEEDEEEIEDDEAPQATHAFKAAGEDQNCIEVAGSSPVAATSNAAVQEVSPKSKGQTAQAVSQYVD
jgi:hypothetical protein